jgi:hypothetical protein
MFSPRTSESVCWPSESRHIKEDNQELLSNKTNKNNSSIAGRRAGKSSDLREFLLRSEVGDGWVECRGKALWRQSLATGMLRKVCFTTHRLPLSQTCASVGHST